MSKLKYGANPNGTGVFTLETPDTNTDRTLTLPDRDGELASIDAVTGSPMMADGTPVVESGSNSDGYWQKFGDGNMECRFRRIAPDGSVQDWTYPAPFVGANPNFWPCAERGAAGDYPYSVVRSAGILVAQYQTDSFASQHSVQLLAKGRWK